MATSPLVPIATAHLFPRLGDALLALLSGLDADDWNRPTVCRGWSVRDVAAHLADSALRRLSIERDGHRPPLEGPPPESYGEIVALLNSLNASWVEASRRLSPRLLVELLAWVEPPLQAHLAGLDPEGRAIFPVSWAGEEASKSWFDVARELTERWHHQQQIRLAVGAPALDDPELSRPVLETFLRALPHRYRDVERAPGAELAVRIAGREPYAYALRREPEAWTLLRGAGAAPAASIELAEEPAWLLLTNGLSAAEARRRARVAGDDALAAQFFELRSVMV